ncbi:IS30 family transposase, partial [Streptomyces sp. NPDC055025]
MAIDYGKRRKPTGHAPQVQKREEYFRLVDQGVTFSEASRIVGINLRTGKRWRNGRHTSGGRKAVPPIRAVAPPSARSRYLCEAERIHIADRLRERATVRAIAAELGRSPSTVSREIRRNGMRLRQNSSRWTYRPHAAQARADARRPRPKPGKISQNPELRDFIQDHLTKRWSPEQVCHALRRNFPDRPEMRVTHETIYQALYVQGRGELRRELTRALRTGRAIRKPHVRTTARRPRFSHPMVMISERPAEAADRAVPGHWEGDLIVGRESRSAIATLVERTTRYLMLVHLPHDHTASHVRDALAETVTVLPAHLRRSLTWDQGAEMGAHHAFTISTGVPVYFCDPASPWQRG